MRQTAIILEKIRALQIVENYFLLDTSRTLDVEGPTPNKNREEIWGWGGMKTSTSKGIEVD